MDISIVTVTWNSEKYIQQQIDSIKKYCADLDYEHIIIDNASTDSTLEILQHNVLEVIANKKNLGFGKANNLGVNKSKGKYILFLNPDMKVTENTMLKKMKDEMDMDSKIGVTSCKLVDKNGKPNIGQGPRRFPTVWRMVALILKLPHIFPSILNKYHYKDKDLGQKQPVDSVRGAFMLVKREVLEKMDMRPFDERYFLWFEEVDFCKEVQKFGYKVVYNPQFSCIDFVAKSFEKVNNYKKQQLFTKSMLQYFVKWESWWSWIWVYITRPIGLGLVYLLQPFKR